VWAPLPSRCSAVAEQRRGGRNAAPRRFKPGSNPGRVPRVWAPRASRYSVGAEQRRGWRNAPPRRAETG